jgi:hypothetical protein
MKFPRLHFARLLCALAALVALPAAAQTLALPQPASHDLYSFADLYRLTVTAEWPLAAPVAPAGGEFLVRTAAGDAPSSRPAAEYVFSIARVAPPQGGLLALAGFAAAVWVARRRLGYAIRG